MKKLLSKVLALLLFINVLIPPSLTSLKAYADGFEAEPSIYSFYDNELSMYFSPIVSGTFHYVVTPENSVALTPSQIASPASISFVKASGSLPCTAGNPGEFVINFDSTDLIEGKDYKIQSVITQGTDFYPALNSAKFSFGGITSANLIQAQDNGFLIQYTSSVSGKLTSKVFPSNTTASASLFENNGPPALATFETGIFANTPQTVGLKSPGYIFPGTYYKVFALLKDKYGVSHSHIFESPMSTAGNKLLSVHYDNGANTDTADDSVVLTFSNPVYNVGSYTDYTIYFDKDSATFESPDITFDHVYDFTPMSSSYPNENQVRLKLGAYIADHGLRLIDTSAEFDNGSFKVVVNPDSGSIEPKLDTNPENLMKTAPLDQTLIHQIDPISSKLSSLEYLDNSTSENREDDSIKVNLSSALPTAIVSGAALNLSADLDNYGGYSEDDVTFIQGTDYYTTGLSQSEVFIQFTSSGGIKLQSLPSATLKVSLSSDMWDGGKLDASVHSLFYTLSENKPFLEGLFVEGRSVDGFNKETYTYNALVSKKNFDLTALSTIVKAVPVSSEVATMITQSNSRVDIMVSTTSGAYRTYQIHMTEEPFSLSSIEINGVALPNFDPMTFNYSYTLPTGTTQIPTMDLRFDNSAITSSDISVSTTGTLPGTMVYSAVVTKDGQTKTITLTLMSQASNPTTPTDPNTPNNPTTPTNPSRDNDKDTTTTTSGQTNDSTPVVSSTTGALENISKNMETLKTPETLNKAIGDLSGYLLNVDKELVNGTAEKAKVIESLTELTKTLEKQQSALASASGSLENLGSFLESLKQVKTTASLTTPTLDKAVEDILVAYTKQAGTVKLEFTGTADGQMSLEVGDLSSAIANQLKSFETAEQMSRAYFSDSDSRSLPKQITLSIEPPKDAQNISIRLTPTVAQSLQNNRIDQLALQVGGSTLSIPSVNIDPNRTLRMEVSFTAPPVQSSIDMPPTQPVVDFNLFENNQALSSFQKPVKLEFKLNQFNLESEAPASLVVLRYDTTLKDWTPVGGIVDPEKGLIYVTRGSLSQYTVMKSKKTMSQADQSWAKAEINAMLNKGIIADTASFSPTSLVTRGEFAAWIAKAYGLKDNGKALSFKDVPKSNANYSAIQAVCQLGIMSGKSKNQFDPNGNLTTEEMAVMVGKVLVLFENKQASEKVKSKYLAELKSSQVASWAAGDTALLMELGLSKSNALADAKALVTKETAAAVLMGAYQS